MAPFGLGNPNVTLLAVGCELELGAVGEGKHLKLAVTANGARSGAIAFGQGTRLDTLRRVGLYDVAFKLAANHWNGTSPQLVVRRIFETPEGYEDLRRALAAEWKAGPDRWSPQARAIFGELELRAAERLAAARRVADLPSHPATACRSPPSRGGSPRAGATPGWGGADPHRILRAPSKLFDELLAEVATYNQDIDRDLLERAYLFARSAHEHQQRRSGEAFVNHLLGVARILAGLRQDDATTPRLSSTTSWRTRTRRSRSSERSSARRSPASSRA